MEVLRKREERALDQSGASWDASIFDTMPFYRYEDKSFYVPMGMFALEEPYVAPFLNETMFIYAAFIGWKVHYSVASLLAEIARSEHSTTGNGTSELSTSYEQYRTCVVRQYGSKLDKVLSIPMVCALSRLW
ncbi:hypothetical protein V5799_005608 [Amblyomma americanum]|uniref:Uncharacterized protein n=1 Tax=Amblyomma americanum TaxID=6943 RepID=A0AAQ4DYS1_AMBAM